jgi:penicillin-binding protein 1A
MPFTMPVGRHHVTEVDPRNSNNKYIGMVTLKKAANSINTISAKLMDKVGPEVVKLTHKLG